MSDQRNITLDELSQALTEWRVHRQPRHIPHWIREQAVNLLRDHRPSAILKALRINHRMLSDWRRTMVSDEPCPAQKPAPVFVTLPVVSEPASASLALPRLTMTQHLSNGRALSLAGELTLVQWQQVQCLLQPPEDRQ